MSLRPGLPCRDDAEDAAADAAVPAIDDGDEPTPTALIGDPALRNPSATTSGRGSAADPSRRQLNRADVRSMGR